MSNSTAGPYRDNLGAENERLRAEVTDLRRELAQRDAKIEAMQRVIDDRSPLGDTGSDYAFDGERCYECGSAIDPGWYGHMGYQRSAPKHTKVCDLCYAERGAGSSADVESSASVVAGLESEK